MNAHSASPWRCLVDLSQRNEQHWMVVDAEGAALFDSINRSPMAEEVTEPADLMLAAAAPLMFAALLEAREFISNERNVFAECNTWGNGAMAAEDQAALDDIDQLLVQVDKAMAAASQMGEVKA